MKRLIVTLTGIALIGGGILVAESAFQPNLSVSKSPVPQTMNPIETKTIYDFTMKSIDGKDVPLSNYKGKVVLIVNVASFCGYTKHYAGLEELYRRYKEHGFVILGFPANNFGQQEPGTDAEIFEFCRSKYDVTFDMFSKISVKGEDIHPLYQFLTANGGDIAWNFEKILIGKQGQVVQRFTHRTAPLSDEIIAAVERELPI